MIFRYRLGVTNLVSMIFALKNQKIGTQTCKQAKT